MLVLATGIVSFGVAQTLYILAFGFQSRQIHTLGKGDYVEYHELVNFKIYSTQQNTFYIIFPY